MQALRKAFGFIWMMWAAVVMIVTTVLVTPFYYLAFWLTGKGKESKAYTVSRIWAATLMYLTLIFLKIHGRQNLNPQQAYIIVANHRSQLDIPICAVANPYRMKYLAKSELARAPLLGGIIARLYLLVDRSTRMGRARSMIAMRNTLQEGMSLLIYPEGTRNPRPQSLLPFQDGAFRLAVDTGYPIAVLTIVGAGESFPPNQLRKIYPKLVHAHWAKPLQTEGLSADDVPALKEQVREIMLRHIKAGT